jgi:hypothetical protein
MQKGAVEFPPNKTASVLMKRLLFQGARLSKVAATFDWLKEEITMKGRDVGFTGDTRDVILYASEVFGEQLVFVTESDG